MKVNELLARIKWKPVLGLIILIALLIAILWIAPSVNLFSSGYKGEGDVRVRTWVEPGRLDQKGKGMVWVDVLNKGDENINAVVNLKAYSKSLVFADSGNQEVRRAVDIGPGESRQLDFRVEFNATDAGKYGLMVSVLPGEIEDEVFFEVSDK